MSIEHPNFKDWICGACGEKNKTEYQAMDYLPILKKVQCKQCKEAYDLVLPSKKTFFGNTKPSAEIK